MTCRPCTVGVGGAVEGLELGLVGPETQLLASVSSMRLRKFPPSPEAVAPLCTDAQLRCAESACRRGPDRRPDARHGGVAAMRLRVAANTNSGGGSQTRARPECQLLSQAGLMFTFRWNRFCGSYLVLISVRRSNFPP